MLLANVTVARKLASLTAGTYHGLTLCVHGPLNSLKVATKHDDSVNKVKNIDDELDMSNACVVTWVPGTVGQRRLRYQTLPLTGSYLRAPR